MPQQPGQFYGFDIAPMVKLHAEQAVLWQKLLGGQIANSGAILQEMRPEPEAAGDRQPNPETLARRMIETQIEYYKFMTHGLQEYKKLLQALPQTSSPMEVAQLYACFYSRMMNACATEARRLREPFAGP